MDDNKEVWKNYTGCVKELHGLLKVSNMGRLYKIGTNTFKHKSGILKGHKNNQGYMRIHLSINGKSFSLPVHRLVAEMFCSNKYNKPFVDHINAIRDDNRASNLRWVTSSENNLNPHYTKKLSERSRKALSKHNFLAESLLKPVIAENMNGKKLHFNSIKDMQKYFNTSANISRKLNTGEYFKTRKSKYYGWKVYTDN